MKDERDPYDAALAAVLNDMYVSKGSPLQQVAAAIGVSRMSVRRYLNGERQIRVGELRNLAAVLDTDIGTILDETERRI